MVVPIPALVSYWRAMPHVPGDPDDIDDDTRELDDEPSEAGNLVDDYEPPPPPIMGPDGGPILEPAPLASPVPAGQGLCDGTTAQYGIACRRYHRMVLSMEVQAPMAKAALDGEGNPIWAPITDDEAAMPLAQQTIHTCYPQPGIEFSLAERHVFQCNLYHPVDPPSPQRAVMASVDVLEHRMDVLSSRVSQLERTTPVKASAVVPVANLTKKRRAKRTHRKK